MIPFVVLTLGACDKKEESKAPEAPVPAKTPTGTPSAAVPTPPTPTPAPVVKPVALTPEQRAAKLGFAKYLPQDTEALIALHNGKKSADRITGSKFWKLIAPEMGMDGKDEPTDGVMSTDPEGEQEAKTDDAKDDKTPDHKAKPDAPFTPSTLFYNEFSIAVGKSAGEQAGNLLKTYGRVNYFQVRYLTKAFAAAAKAGDRAMLQDVMGQQYGKEIVKDMLADPESGLGVFEQMKMPPLYLAFRVSENDIQAAGNQLSSITQSMGMLGPVVEAVDVERAGQKFSGYKLSGAKISEQLGKERKQMEEQMDSAMVDRLMAAVAKKDLVVLTGTIGDYAVLFIGSSVDDMVLAADPGQSMLATDALAFCDPYASKDLAMVVHGKKETLDKIADSSASVAQMAGAIRDGLAGSEGFGDTRDLEALLRMVGDREAALKKLSCKDTLGVVAFFDQGLKIETFGGVDTGAIDWKTPNTLASLGNQDDVVMFANMTADATYDETLRSYLETLVETGYAISKKVSAVQIEGEGMEQFREMSKMFDEKFRTDVVSLWDAYSGDLSNGLGKETAFVVDLKGTVPAIPGIPQAVVNEGKFPRISLIKPVKDRAKIATSWDKMNVSITNILAKAKELTGKDIPMQKPISSDKNGCTTWFFTFPFLNDDFVPSVTVCDKWFVASTSKNQALDLIAKADKGGDTSKGLVFTLNFKALQKFAGESHKMFEKNAQEIMGEDAPSPEQIAKAAKVIEAMAQFDKLTVSANREGGVLRTSIHFKTL